MFDFHFLRPALLLALPILALLYWALRRRLISKANWQKTIAPHLVKALTPRQSLLDKFKPVDLVAVIAFLLVFAAAGPAWYKAVDEAEKSPPVVLVLKLGQTMLANDLQPNRLTRAKQKITDLLSFRAGAKTALIVYADSSHKVLPMTEDNRVFQPFVEALSPDIMPNNASLGADDAAAAIELAAQEVERAGEGVVILMADNLQPGEVEKLNQSETPFIWWQFATEQGGVIVSDSGAYQSDDSGQALNFALNPTIAAELDQVITQKVTLNNQDLLALDSAVRELRREALRNNPNAPYQDMAWYFIWPVLGLMALWFRKGFTSTGAQIGSRGAAPVLVALFIGFAMQPQTARADVLDWFVTPDQQGYWQFQKNHFERAAQAFADPMWKATALYEEGKYNQAANLFATIGTLEAMYNRANALLKAHQYYGAVAAYQQVLKEQPGFAKAERNLAITQAIIQELIDAGENIDAEQSISLEVDDRQAKPEEQTGKSQQYQVGDTLSEDAREKWMRSVDSDMSDFLSAKFANEANNPVGDANE
ncbi:VWA domain-containing protein [Gilvimarinus xylanilyticus]|uniref:VWA domain-containing protein n=1 Tax=Gilvimarinus xylanilyticus TaxID=2944139 RepID=A0A9X2HYU7_9GAMM|nr:VWA domain-containing protein [Gilvimarinus xylanilyticus]MCP8899574.1 VWA domain-containing protein [Gilvimarinus xylanilyticus]